MQEDASIRMTVDSSQAMSEQQKYLRGATETFNILQQKSESYGRTLQQRIKFMERELELMRENTRLNTQEELRGIQSRYDKGTITKKVRDLSIADTKQAEKEDIEELKQTNKILRQWVQEQKDTQRRGESFLHSLTNTGVGALRSDSAAGMISGGSSGLLAGLGFAGLIAGLLVSKGVRGAATMEPVMRDYARLMGTTLLGTRDAVRDISVDRLGDMGLTPSQYFTQYSQYYRSSGGRVRENMLGIIAAEKATGIGQQEISQLLGLERYGQGQITPIISYFERYLRQTSQSIAVLPEILQTFATESSVMLRNTGKVDSNSVAASISAISRGFGLQGEPLSVVTGAMRQGLQQSSNPIIQALQFSAMDRAMPGASLWQMEMAMENPLQNSKYITGFLRQLRKITGGGDMYARSLYNVFGQFGVSKNIANMMSTGELTPEMFLEKFSGTGGYEGRAKGVTGQLESLTSKWQGGFEKVGFVAIEQSVEELRKILGDFSSGIKTVIEGVQNNQVEVIKDLDEALNIARGTRDASEKMAKALNIYFSRGGMPFVNQFQ